MAGRGTAVVIKVFACVNFLAAPCSKDLQGSWKREHVQHADVLNNLLVPPGDCFALEEGCLETNGRRATCMSVGLVNYCKQMTDSSAQSQTLSIAVYSLRHGAGNFLRIQSYV